MKCRKYLNIDVFSTVNELFKKTKLLRTAALDIFKRNYKTDMKTTDYAGIKKYEYVKVSRHRGALLHPVHRAYYYTKCYLQKFTALWTLH